MILPIICLIMDLNQCILCHIPPITMDISYNKDYSTTYRAFKAHNTLSTRLYIPLIDYIKASDHYNIQYQGHSIHYKYILG